MNDPYGVKEAQDNIKMELASILMQIDTHQSELETERNYFAKLCVQANKLNISDQIISDIANACMINTKGLTRARIQQIRAKQERNERLH